jgi:hypothetical protein
MNIRWFSYIIFVLLAFAAGCASFPVPNRSSTAIPSVQHQNLSVTATATFAATATVRAIPPTVVDKLQRVVYAKGGAIWLWDAATGSPKQLTSFRGDNPATPFKEQDQSPKISEDGQVIAFIRDNNLWAMDGRGENQRMLVSAADLASLSRSTAGMYYLPRQFDFARRSHDVYFNIATMMKDTTDPEFNLAKVSADSPGVRALLNDSQGGEDFVFSPDGTKIALPRSNKINVVNADGTGLKTIFSFQPIKMKDAAFYIPEIVWLSDGSGFKTVLPGPDSAAPARFMFISSDGAIVAKLAEFNASPFFVGHPFISPDGSRVLYTKMHGTGLELHVIDAGTADKTYFSHAADAFKIFGWAPDSRNFLCEMDGATWLVSQAGSLTELSDVSDVEKLVWVDAQHFLFIAHDSSLRYRSLSQPGVVLDDGLDDGTFDFVAAP